VSGLGGEKSSDEVVSTWVCKCLSSYSCFYIELDLGTGGWQEGAGSRRGSYKKQSGYSVNPRREVGSIFGQAVVLWEPVCGTLQQMLGQGESWVLFMCSEERIVRESLHEEDTPAICKERHKARGFIWPQNKSIKLQCFKPTSLIQNSFMEVGVTFPFALFNSVIFSIFL